jgi:hypothetical protein
MFIQQNTNNNASTNVRLPSLHTKPITQDAAALRMLINACRGWVFDSVFLRPV